MLRLLALPLALGLGCAPESPEPAEAGPTGYVLGSVVITPDGRTSYFQVLDDLEPDAPITNEGAVETPGNSVMMVHGADVFVGLADEPVWVRYTVDAAGQLSETGRVSFAGQGLRRIEFGNVVVDDDLAVTVSAERFVAIVWNPRTMRILRTVDLAHLRRSNFILETFTTSAHDGLVYIPGRWGNVPAGRVYHAVSMTILDPRAGVVMGIAEDERCASGGRPVFDADGIAYVMGDGRNLSAQMIANSGGEPAEPTCLLRILPGATEFDPEWHVEIPSLTGGLDAATELELAEAGTGVGFSWMFHPLLLPEGFEVVDFTFWEFPVFELWQIELSETPTARPVEGVPFGVLGFLGSPVDGKLYAGVGDTETSVVYEVDPATSSGAIKFEMDGYLRGLYRLGAE
ncbi:MAG: hypothetical protein AAF602_27115 [Myxococcota bacterium]